MNENKFTIKTIGYIFGLLLIGALGTGLWDLFLRDFIFYLGSLIVHLVSSIYGGYVDSLYQNVGKAKKDSLLYVSSYFIIGVFLATYPLILIAFVGLMNKLKIMLNRVNGVPGAEDESLNKKIKQLKFVYKYKSIIFYLLLIASIFIPLSYINMLIKETANTIAIERIERTMEIVRPKINDQKYYELRSQFRLVDDKDKLVALLSELVKISNENHIILPNIYLWGIEIPQNNKLTFKQ